MTITRKDLQNMYQMTLEEENNKRIEFQFDSIDKTIHRINAKGGKEWTQSYYKENSTILDRVVLKLKEKYVDSKITINYKCDDENHSEITVDWST
jgi:hypothetical protein